MLSKDKLQNSKSRLHPKAKQNKNLKTAKAELEGVRQDLATKENKIAALQEQTASKAKTEQALITAGAELDGVRKDLEGKRKLIEELERQTETKRDVERELELAKAQLLGLREDLKMISKNKLHTKPPCLKPYSAVPKEILSYKLNSKHKLMPITNSPLNSNIQKRTWRERGANSKKKWQSSSVQDLQQTIHKLDRK